ncbi:MAG: CPBP family intramembrane metalloprotease [Candidatus Melainabacteria bacterium]|nr:CPBP family intramembrane metalloprotease [Candidatus Melainabacteria bacterium]
MFLQKDEKSKFDFISIKEFLLALFLMVITTIFSFIFIPVYLKKIFPVYSGFFSLRYFDIFVFFLSTALSFYIIYYFCCKRKYRTLKEGLFFYPVSKRTLIFSILIGIIMPLSTAPIMFKFAPHEFFAMDMAKTNDGIIYLFTCALFAPVFEEVFYRGFIFPFFQSKLNSFWAVLITALFFGFSHFMNIGNAHILVSLFIFYGFVLTLSRYFTSSLTPPIITHFVHNLTLISCFLYLSKIS